MYAKLLVMVRILLVLVSSSSVVVVTVCLTVFLFSRQVYFWMHISGAIIILVLTYSPPKLAAREEKRKEL